MGHKKTQSQYKSSRKNILKTQRLIESNNAILKKLKENES